MVKAVDGGQFDYRARFGWSYGSTVGCVVVQRPMCSPWMVIVQIGRQESFQMVFVEDNDVVEEFPANAADQTFKVSVCQGEAGAVTSSTMPRLSSLR